jgi:hypothetical protein
MTKGRATLPWRAVAGKNAFSMTLSGPKAHESSGRDDNFFVFSHFDAPNHNVFETHHKTVILSEAQWRDLLLMRFVRMSQEFNPDSSLASKTKKETHRLI